MPQTDEKKKKSQLTKIKSSPLSRSVSLINIAVGSGARYASLKWADLLQPKDKQPDRFAAFLSAQAQSLVAELGKLKGSVMKAGQMLSVYGEHFFPPEVNRILKALHSDSQPLVWEEIHAVLLRQLGAEKLAELEIEPEPIGAASMGQVYRARIKRTGVVCALKVQYPGVDRAIASDLRALKSVLALSQLVPKGPRFDEIFQEIRAMLQHEADYSRELEMLEQYRLWLADDPRYIIPKVYPEYSTKRVLCMSYEEGLAVDSPEVAALAADRRNRLGAAALELMYREIFEWRWVQTDPHFGNYRIRLADLEGAAAGCDRLVLLDFGAVRKFPKKYIAPFAALVRAALEGDPEKTGQLGKTLGFLRDGDPESAISLFRELCFTAVEPFHPQYESPAMDGSSEGPSPYCWGESDLLGRLSKLAKDAIFTFKLRSPPREAVFLDRKMVGMFVFVATLKLRMGPRKMMLHYLDKLDHTPHAS